MSESEYRAIDGFCDYVGGQVKVTAYYKPYQTIGMQHPFACAVDLDCDFMEDCHRSIRECPLMKKAELYSEW